MSKRLRTNSFSSLPYVVTSGLGGFQNVPFPMPLPPPMALPAYSPRSDTTMRTQESTYRANQRRAYLAGKVKPKKKTSRKLKIKKRKGKGKGKTVKTRLGLAVSGVHTSEEHRFVSKQDMVAADRYEAVAVGHTSIPQKTVLMNMCRALIKFCLKKILHIKEFSHDCTSLDHNYAMRAGDILRFEYYGDWNSNTTNNFSITIVANQTFESIANTLRTNLLIISDDGNIGHLRWKDFEYEPTNTVPNNKYAYYSISLRSLQVEIKTKSSMKVQNRTVNVVGVEDDADDVDNVPVVGYLYSCKGNNFVRKSDRKILNGIDSTSVGGSSATANNDVILFEGTKKSIPSYSPNQATFIIGAEAENQFNKPSEPPKPYQVVNCKKSSKIRINPGGIKTSIVTARTKVGFSYMLDLLNSPTKATKHTDMTYSPKVGYTNVMYLEKTIGSNTSPVAVACEVQFDCWCAVTAKSDSRYTNTATYQADYGIIS